MKKERLTIKNRGFSLVEVILASAIFSLLVTAMVGSFLYGQESSAIFGNKARAVFLAEEGLEAVRNMRDNSFPSLVDGVYGLATSSNKWIFSGSSDVTDIFTRQITVTSIDGNKKSITANISWQQNPQRVGSVTLDSILTNWRRIVGGGMLVYGDGGTTNDAIKYKILDSETQNWLSPVATADIDTGTTNRALRAARLFSSATRNEKVLVSRHYNGATQYIYAQVYNGATQTWSNVQLLSQWNATTFLDVQNFDGTYLNNGDFMVVYTNNDNIPMFGVWNGSIWSVLGVAIQSIPKKSIPAHIVLKNRPSSNEAMLAIFDQSKIVTTQYFKGGAYVTDSWTSSISHPTKANSSSLRLVDFDWSPNNSNKGALVFVSNNTNKSLSVKIWTADGIGGGSWGSVANTSNQSSIVGSLSIAGQLGTDIFLFCDKDQAVNPRVICYKSNFTPTISTTINNTITTNTETGIERSYHIGWGLGGRNFALNVFSERTVTPYLAKYKKYDIATDTWDLSPTVIDTSPYTPGNIGPVKIISQLGKGDMMVLMSDSNSDLYSVVWDDVNNVMYAAADGKAFSRHGINGSAAIESWYDFVWD